MGIIGMTGEDLGELIRGEKGGVGSIDEDGGFNVREAKDSI